MPKKTTKLETDGQAVVKETKNHKTDQKSFAQAVEAVGTGSALGYRLQQ